jgi:hypothetical protein
MTRGFKRRAAPVSSFSADELAGIERWRRIFATLNGESGGDPVSPACCALVAQCEPGHGPHRASFTRLLTVTMQIEAFNGRRHMAGMMVWRNFPRTLPEIERVVGAGVE